MTGIGETGCKPKGASWEFWVEQQIRVAMERGEFENLPGTSKPLPGMAPDVEIHHDEVNRRSAEGPPSTVMPLDEEAVVAKWCAQRDDRADGR